MLHDQWLLCPACGAPRLESVWDGYATDFVCRPCGRWWTVTLGRIYEVPPARER